MALSGIPAVAAIWCIRGGYGVTRILDQVDFDALAPPPASADRLLRHHRPAECRAASAGVVTFHAPDGPGSDAAVQPMALRAGADPPEPAGRLGRLPTPPDVLRAAGEPHRGPCGAALPRDRWLGGNLSLIQCLIGTPYFPDLDGAILFLEDVGEELYRVDRMLAHLRMVGAFSGGWPECMVGRFTGLERGMSDGALGFDEVLATYLLPLGIPVAYGFPIGHIDDQWTLPLGVRARLDADAGEVELLEPAVSP